MTVNYDAIYREKEQVLPINYSDALEVMTALNEACLDLECEIAGRYPDNACLGQKRKYQRDIRTVERGREILKKLSRSHELFPKVGD